MIKILLFKHTLYTLQNANATLKDCARSANINLNTVFLPYMDSNTSPNGRRERERYETKRAERLYSSSDVLVYIVQQNNMRSLIDF